jgi:diguanylate cyclase (GGDEF)-like protein
MGDTTPEPLVLRSSTRRWMTPAASADLRSFLVQIYPVTGGYGLVELVGDHLLVGRDVACDVVIVDEAVSRRHAAIERTSQGFTIIDLESTNGTYVNDVRSRERVLTAGDRIRIGSHIYKFLADDQLEAQYHECVYAMATRDGLTAAFNKRYLLDALHREIAQYERHCRPLTLLMIDVDHFKKINDRFGHLAGDEVLMEICRRAENVIRRGEVLARYGGEEFAVILCETSLEDARLTAERLRDEIAGNVVKTSHGDVPVTVSIGMACHSTTVPITANELIDLADRQLYAAKAAGRNCVCG